MAYRPLTDIPQQFFDSLGDPLAGGTLYAYLAGTSTPTNLYSDNAGTVAGTSVTLDSRGEPTTFKLIWLDTTKIYKLVLKDSLGSTVWTVDNISGDDGTGSSASSVFDQQTITATASQTLFNLGFEYVTGTNAMAVYKNGSRLITTTDFTETSSTSVTLTQAAQAGDEYTFIGGQDVSSSFSSSNVAFIQAGTGATIRSVQTKLREFVSVTDFGTNQAAIVSAVAEINSRGGGVLSFAGGTYSIASVVDSILFHFQDCDGVVLDFTGATFTDSTAYTPSGATVLQGDIFGFTNCTGIKFIGDLVGTANSYIATSDRIGASWVNLYGDTNGFDGGLQVVGGRNGFLAEASSGTAVDACPRNINVRVKATDTYYPYSLGFAGDNATAKLELENVGRPFFVNSSTKQDITVFVKDQQNTALVKVYEGQKAENIKIYYYNKDTTDMPAAAPLIGIHYGDQTPAVIRDVDIELNLDINASVPWNSVIAFAKYQADGTTADSTARGHILENIRIYGVADHTGASINFMQTTEGALAAGDYARNIIFENFTGIGSAGNIVGTFFTAALVAPMVWRNVNIPGNVNLDGNPSTAPITFDNCQVANFSTTTGCVGYHVYRECRITNGALQSITNKKMDNTFFNGLVRNTLQDGFYITRAVKVLTGNLTGTNNVFKLNRIQFGVGCRFTLKYTLVADYSDDTPASRDETIGIKTFTATINTSGVWSAQLAVADQITERTQGTASVVTVSLVNGDSTGGHIAVACTNYNGANAVGIFEIVCETFLANGVVTAV